MKVDVKMRMGNVSGQWSVVSGGAGAAGWPVAERAGAGGISLCGGWACTKVSIVALISVRGKGVRVVGRGKSVKFTRFAV